MKRHGSYTIIYENQHWTIFKAQGGINQVLVKRKSTGETYAFEKYRNNGGFFAEDGTPQGFLACYIHDRVAKALGCSSSISNGRYVACYY